MTMNSTVSASLPSLQNWLFYAYGEGLGHFNRTMSLAIAAGERGVRSIVVANSPLLHYLDTATFPGVTLRICSSLKKTEFVATFADILQTHVFDVVLLDTWPMGVSRELENLIPDLASKAVFIHRRMQREKMVRDTDWINAHIDLVVVPGEGASLTNVRAVTTPPWVSLSSEMLLPRPQARTELNAHDDKPVIGFVGAGTLAESATMRIRYLSAKRALSGRAHLRYFGPRPLIDRDHFSTWPMFRFHAALDLVVGQGGYNTVHECRASGVPLLGIAQPRGLDNQRERLQHNEIVDDDTLLARIQDVIEHGPPRFVKPPPFENGVFVALDLILSLGHRPNHGAGRTYPSRI